MEKKKKMIVGKNFVQKKSEKSRPDNATSWRSNK